MTRLGSKGKRKNEVEKDWITAIEPDGAAVAATCTDTRTTHDVEHGEYTISMNKTSGLVAISRNSQVLVNPEA